MKTIKLYGSLGATFGKEFNLDVKSTAEAIRALSTLIPNFRKYLNDNSEPGYIIKVDNYNYNEDSELQNPLPKTAEIKIIPVIAGSDAAAITFLGITLIAASFIPGLNAAAPYLFNVGVAMTFSGVAEMLAPSPKLGVQDLNTPPEETPSYMFDGPVNVTGSGNAIPVGYGELLIGSLVVSAELYSVED